MYNYVRMYIYMYYFCIRFINYETETYYKYLFVNYIKNFFLLVAYIIIHV